VSGKLRYKAFTLIEILLVVALISIFAAITIVALNPAKNFANTRNAQRSSDVREILSAVTQYTSEQDHSIDDFKTIIDCKSGAAIIGTTVGKEYVDLSVILVDEYIIEIPMDPSVGTVANTGYTICTTSSGRIQVDAPNAENGKTIVVKR